MIPCRLLGVCAVLAGAVLLTTAFASQDKAQEKGAKDAKATPASAPADDAEMMAKWAAFATPGPDHKVLDPLVGSWTSKMKCWMDPSGQPEESEGNSDFKWIFGGRYLEENVKGTVMGQPFEGRAVFGFDNLKKKYVSSWCDNMGTGIMSSEGTYDASKKAITFTGQGPDATMSKYVSVRMVSTFVDPNTFKFEMFAPDKAGKEFKSMEMTYTRKK